MAIDSHPPHNEKPVSLPPSATAVPAGEALHRIRLELGLIALFAPVVWLVIDKLTADLAWQLTLLAGYGLLAMFWLLLRIRRLLARHGGR